MKSDVPSMAAKVDALMDSVKPTYASSAYYLTDAGKQELASDMNTIKQNCRADRRICRIKESGSDRG